MAGARTLFIDCTVVAVEENAALVGSPKNDLVILLRRHGGVLRDELFGLDSEVAGQPFDVALIQIRFRDFTAIGAGAAIDLLLDFLGYAAKSTLRKVVNLHVPPELFVLFQLLLAEAFYLDKIRYH